MNRIVKALRGMTPVALAAAAVCHAQTDPEAGNAPVKSLGIVTIQASSLPTSLPTTIPTTTEGITRAQIERSINASDSEDALKYFPSLLVRKRYIGDYNHAILSSRASGTGNSARSAVYADGILLSNYLGNGVGGLSFPPRWGMVAPEEIERVDVMYGPFSAAYPGNSVGAVVVYVTRMPSAFEVHARVGYSHQPFELYNTHGHFNAWKTSASVGDKAGSFSWLLGFSHADSHGQPLTFVTRLVSAGSTTVPAGTPALSGAVLDANNTGVPWYVLGTGTEYHTKQDQFKARLAWDVTPTVRASYALGVWHNVSENRPKSYLTDATGAPVTSGPFSIDGRAYTGTQALGAGDFVFNAESLTHVMHGLALKSHTRGVFDWELAASLYDYRKDEKRANAGTLADGSGTGWVNLAAKGTWRPLEGHVLDFGLQQDRYELNYRTSNIAGDWRSGPVTSLASNVKGRTELQSAYAQDAWDFATHWKTVLGLRAERWRASDGLTQFSSTQQLAYPERGENHLSPKAALSFQASDTLVLKASAGRAVRFPTVSELYGATSTANSQYINDPNLRPERSWTTEFSGEQDLGGGQLRMTLFTEDTHDSLYSQTSFDPAANRNISRVQNVGRIATQGLETAYSGHDVGTKGLDLQGSVTWAKSLIKENTGFVATPGDTLGKWQPNIPRWRAAALASWRFAQTWTASFGARYSGVQYRTLNNGDINGFTYQGVSKFFTTDVRLHVRIDRRWSAAVGIDNLNNYRFWNFHPYPQRNVNAELRFDL